MFNFKHNFKENKLNIKTCTIMVLMPDIRTAKSNFK